VIIAGSTTTLEENHDSGLCDKIWLR